MDNPACELAQRLHPTGVGEFLFDPFALADVMQHARKDTPPIRIAPFRDRKLDGEHGAILSTRFKFPPAQWNSGDSTAFE